MAAPAARTRPDSPPISAIETPRLVLRPRAVPGGVDFALYAKPGLEEAGWIAFTLREEGDRVADLRFLLFAAHRGRGLMREAACAAAPPALRLLRAGGLSAKLPADAQAAHKIARALGLTPAAHRGAMQCFEKDLCGLL